ncbi:hypothetical protein [Devosia sp.]
MPSRLRRGLAARTFAPAAAAASRDGIGASGNRACLQVRHLPAEAPA